MLVVLAEPYRFGGFLNPVDERANGPRLGQL